MAQPCLFYVYESRNPKRDWRWHLMTGNGTVIAVTGQGYPNKNACIEAIHRLSIQVADSRIVLAPEARRFAKRIAKPS